MERKMATEISRELEFLAVSGVDVEGFVKFAKDLAEACGVVIENFKELVGRLARYLGCAESTKKIRRLCQSDVRSFKMTDQVICRKPMFMVRKIIR